MHTADVLAPTALEYEPASQIKHKAEPCAGWYVPAGHCSQAEGRVAPATPEKDPALQSVQFVIEEEALLVTWEKEPALHCSQVATPAAELPGAQHAPAPASLKLEGQPVQALEQ